MIRDADRTTTIVMVQTVVPDYRTSFYAELASRLGPQFTLLAGSEDWERDVRTTGSVAYRSVRNVFIAHRRLLWQVGTLRPMLGADVAVLSLNPRILTSWIGLIGRRAMRRRTVLWGHAWPRRGRHSWTDKLRAIMRKLAHTIIVYSETEAADLAAAAPGIDVVAAPNALYRYGELGPPRPVTGLPTDIVCVGRLSRSKAPGLLLEAFEQAIDSLPADVRLVYVGDGPLREILESRTEHLGLRNRVVFAGHISTLDELRTVYSRAIASAAPGEVGLSLIQSHGFGVPMIMSWLPGHGPEIEAAEDGVNVITFRAGAPQSLAEAIVSAATNRENWLARRESIAASTRARYSVEGMAEAFVRTLSI